MHKGAVTLQELMGTNRPASGRIGLFTLARMMRRTVADWSPPTGYTTPKRDKVTVSGRVVEVPVPRRIARRMRARA